MFGIKRMHQQRDRLYLRTQLLEKRAKASRDKAIDNALDKATSPAGLIASFVLGATTQLDITRKARKSLLNGASRDVLSFLVAQVSAYVENSTWQANTSAENTSSDGEEQTTASQQPHSDEESLSQETHSVTPKDTGII
jgi:hypothetical protein